MTRDDAIKTLERLNLLDPRDKGGHDDGGVRNLVDALAALGLLKLERPENIGAVPPEHATASVAKEKDWGAEAMRLYGFCLGGERDYRTVATALKDIYDGLGQMDGKISIVVRVTPLEMAAPPRCEPPPAHREKRWHWLRNGHGNLVVRFWNAEQARFRESHEHSHPVLMDAEKLYSECGWRYVAPCEEPALDLEQP